MTVDLDDLWERPIEDLLPPLDRAGVHPSDDLQGAWQEDGLVVLPGFLPDDLIEAYCEAYDGGWGIGTPYLTSPALRDLALHHPLMDVLENLIGEPMGLHLNLTWWRSTERGWHQDDYLNPPTVNGWYAAVWMALADIHPDSGPFEFIRGSHRWPLLRRNLVLDALGEDGSDPDWPWRSEALLDPLFEAKIEEEGHVRERFLAKRGDVLIWHARLLHRGSRPHVPGMERRSLISHYSGVNHRPDMPEVALHRGVGRYFVLGPVA